MSYGDHKQELEEKGFTHIKSFYPKDELIEINKKIIRIISTVFSRVSNKCIKNNKLDDGEVNDALNYMKFNRRDLISIIYDAVKTIPEFCRLVASEKNIELVKSMRNSDFVGITRGGEGIRIDLPGEKKFMAPWHQDYLSQFGSSDGLVFWAPLINISIDVGPLQVLVGSHKEGLLPIYYEDEKAEKNAYGMKILDQDTFVKKYKMVDLICEVGDLLLLDFKAIHRSGFNSYNGTRWSMQMRYFNFNDPLGISKGWPGGFGAGKTIAQIHPELIVSLIGD